MPTQPAPGAPVRIAEAGRVVFCTDISYPPLEGYTEDGEPVGVDIAVGKELARRFAVEPKFRDTSLEVLFVALTQEKCDAAISGLMVGRRFGTSFVPYLRVGRSLMVRRGDGRGIATVDALAGHSVSVELGSVNRDRLAAASRRLRDRGLPPIRIQGFVDNATAAGALRAGRVDAFYGDFPVVARFVAADRRSYAFAGGQIDAAPMGIAVRRVDREVRRALAREVAAMYRDGTMARILAQWEMGAAALRRYA